MTPGAQSLIQGSVAPNAQQINPYVNNVIQQAKDQATQYYQNVLAPTTNNKFTASGQAGSSANTRALGQNQAQVTQNIQDTANSALSQAYQNAQQANLGAGSALGSLAQTTGGLGYEGGILGLQGAGALGTLANTGQNLGLTGANALNMYGQQVQQNQQQNLDTAYQNFLNQQQYPYQQLGWLSNLMSGTIPGTTPGGQTTQQQQVPYNQGSGNTPFSLISSGLGTLFPGQG
jgi:hypothetical protein